MGWRKRCILSILFKPLCAKKNAVAALLPADGTYNYNRVILKKQLNETI